MTSNDLQRPKVTSWKVMIYNTNSDKYWYWDIEQAGYIWNMDENRDLCIGGKHWQLRTAIFRSDFFDLSLSKYSFCNTGSVYSTGINQTSTDMDSKSPESSVSSLSDRMDWQRTTFFFSENPGKNETMTWHGQFLSAIVWYKCYPYSRYVRKQETKIVIVRSSTI